MATVGRKPRKRASGAGSAVSVKSHTRTPRGPNQNKRPVNVNAYRRGKPRRHRGRVGRS